MRAAAAGALASSAYIIGALIAIRLHPRPRVVALVMAFGAGALISAAAYLLVLEATHVGEAWVILVGLLAGSLAFYAGNQLVQRGGGGDRKQTAQTADTGAGQALFLGALLDGLPETAILGMTLATEGSIGVALLVAIFASNIPEGMASTSGMTAGGWATRRILGHWFALVAACTLTAALGYVLVANIPSTQAVLPQAFAAGAILAMLADTMFPEAYRHGGNEVGILTVSGYAFAALLAAIEAGH